MKMTRIENKEVSQLNQITDRLLALAEIDQLYFSSYNFGNSSVKELLVLIPKINSQHLLEVRPIVGMVMCAHSHVKYQIYYVDEVRRSILQGGGAFIEKCHFDNLVYINPTSSPVMNKIPDIQAYLKKASRNFERECSKIESFKEGADFYFKKRDLQLCAFMLHQTFELLYRMSEIVFLGREKISHHLRSHHQLMLPYLQTLLTIFDTTQEYDMYLLELLNEAYLSVRYENNYGISMEDMECLLAKGKEIEILLTECCSKMIAHYQTTYANVQNDIEVEVLSY